MIERNYRVEGDLRRRYRMNIKRLMDIGCYRGLRHRRGLPVARAAHPHQRPHPQGAEEAAPSAQEEGSTDEVGQRSRRTITAAAGERGGTMADAEEEGQEEGPQERADGRGPHPGDLQQHDHHDHRPGRATRSPGPAPGAKGFKGSRKSTPFAASGRGGRREEGAWTGHAQVKVYVKGPGRAARRRFARLQAAGLKIN